MLRLVMLATMYILSIYCTGLGLDSLGRRAYYMLTMGGELLFAHQWSSKFGVNWFNWVLKTLTPPRSNVEVPRPMADILHHQLPLQVAYTENQQNGRLPVHCVAVFNTVAEVGMPSKCCWMAQINKNTWRVLKTSGFWCKWQLGVSMLFFAVVVDLSLKLTSCSKLKNVGWKIAWFGFGISFSDDASFAGASCFFQGVYVVKVDTSQAIINISG